MSQSEVNTTTNSSGMLSKRFPGISHTILRISFPHTFKLSCVVLRVPMLYTLCILAFTTCITMYADVSGSLSPSRAPPLFNFRSYTEPTVLDIPELKRFCDHEVVWQQEELTSPVYINCHSIIMGAFNAINKLQVCFPLPSSLTTTLNNKIRSTSKTNISIFDLLISE